MPALQSKKNENKKDSEPRKQHHSGDRESSSREFPDLFRILLSFLVSVTAVLGLNAVTTHRFLFIHDNPHASLAATGLTVLVFTAVLSLVSCRIRFDSLIKIHRKLNPAVFFTVIFLTNLILLLGYYPGTQSWDTWIQLNDYFDGLSTAPYREGGGMMLTAFLNDHQPVATTLLFGAFADLGKLLHNEELGIFLYSLLQISLYAFACTKAVTYYDAGRNLSGWAVAAFYLLNPFLCYYAIMMLKDSLFSVLFLLYMLDLIRLWRRENGKGLLIGFAVLSILLPLTKKTGIYIVLVSNIFLFARTKGSRRAFKTAVVSSVAAPALIMFILLPRVLFPAFNVYPGGKQEVIGTLLQQSVRVGLDHPEAYSEEDRAILNRVFDYDAAEKIYDHTITDPVKSTYRLETVTDQDLSDYYRLWLRTGFRYPESCLTATAETCGGYFSPTVKLEVYRENHSYELTDTRYFVIIREVADLIYDFLLNCPGLNLLLYMVVYTWWIPMGVTYVLVRKRGWKSLGFMIPVFVSILTLIVTPYSFSRYALPFVMITPLLLCEAKENPVHDEIKIRG